MRTVIPRPLLCVVVALLFSIANAIAARPPNIVFILADDLGYGDIGAFGQEKIATPNLDRLAAQGMRFRQHYSGSPVCAPSRCVLMTGKHSGHAWIRDNREVQPEGQPPLPAGTRTIARMLKEKGYATCAVGKWGLGFPGSEGAPLNQGFDRFFGYNCQRQAHNFYPTSLWNNATRIMLKNAPFAAHQRLARDARADSAESYRQYAGADYAPDRIRDAAMEFITTNGSRPFFLYFATTVPHLALQVPEDSLAEYKGRWPDPAYTGTNSYLPHQHPRAAYAAMVSRMDRDIGSVISAVAKAGLEENTVFIFTSDNGPLYNRLGGTDTEFFNSAGGLRGRKGSLYEGGVRVPLIVRWQGRVATNTVSDRITGFEDWLPTLAALTGATAPQGVDGISFLPTLLGQKQDAREFLYREFPAYNGWQSVRAGDWKLVKHSLRAPRAGRAAGRSGRAAQADGAREAAPELYDLGKDPNEMRNLAAAHPEIVMRLEKIARREHEPSPLFPFPPID
jgi:arylsulfatase A